MYEQVVPAGYDDSTRLPVVLNWHGLGSSGVEQLAFSDYTALADAEGFIVIVPTGLEDATGLNSWELAPEQFADRDDLAFANTLLDQVIGTLCVDDSRVYTTGMSNGGYFSSVLVCEMSDRIAAAASVAALSHADSCDPSRVVPYIGFHGTNDEVVPYDGGESSMAPGQSVPLFELKILDEFAEFAAEAGCDVEPRVAQLSPQVTSFDFQNCADDVQMTFYEIEGGGHSWPGSAVSLAVSEAIGLGATTDEISASETSWAFLPAVFARQLTARHTQAGGWWNPKRHRDLVGVSSRWSKKRCRSWPGWQRADGPSVQPRRRRHRGQQSHLPGRRGRRQRAAHRAASP